MYQKGILPRRGARIPETRTSRCRRCGSGDIVQNGRNRYGNQQYPCKACGAYGVLELKGRYMEAQKEQILRAYPKGGPLGKPPVGGRKPIGASGRPTADLLFRGQEIGPAGSY